MRGKTQMSTCECCTNSPSVRTRLVRGGGGHGTSMSMCAHCFSLNDDEVWTEMTRHLIKRINEQQ